MSKITVHAIPRSFYGGITTPEVLKGGEIQMWQAPNEVDSEDYQELRQLLSTDEMERAARFRFERHRMQYVIGRSLLRILLAGYLQADARKISFHYTSKGKPELPSGGQECSLQFNIAHSGDIILLGFTRNRKIGVDVEQIREDVEVDEIAQRFFSLLERQHLASLPPSQRYGAFFRFWTRKEALLKGTGEGLSVSLDLFSVLSNPDEDSCVLQADGERKWLIQDVEVGAGYAGAVAVKYGNCDPAVLPE